MKPLVLILLITGLAFRLSAQEIHDIERLLESNAIISSEEGYEDMVNTLVGLSNDPLNLNTADFDSLKILFFLSDNQIDNILIFRKKYGVFLHPNELLLVVGIGWRDLENIRPFITLGNVSLKDRMTVVSKHIRQETIGRVRTTLPFSEGYQDYSPGDFKKQWEYLRKQDSRFHGPPLGALVKYKITSGDYLQMGLTLENDAGEAWFSRDQKAGFDFLSAHLSVTTSHLVRKFILGDFRLQWGQGLVAWGGFASGKSSIAVGNEKSGKGFVPYTSTDENNFFRGIALSMSPLRNLTSDLFFSVKKTDGNLWQNDTLQEEALIASLYQTGFHRSNTECRKKQNLRELSTGVSVRWNTNYFKAGVNTVYYNFTPYLDIGDALYQQYGDAGSGRYLVSVDYKTGFQNIYLFGETAVSNNGTLATVDGLRFSSPKVAFCLLYRRYDKKYVSHYAGGFGEYSNTSNEEGFYFGADIAPIKDLKLNVYYDWFRFFSPRYNASVPGAGKELLCEISYTPGIFGHVLFIKNEAKPENLTSVNSVSRTKNEYRYQFNYTSGKLLELRTRLSFSQYQKAGKKEKGYMIFQDVIFTTRKADFKTQFRLARFDTDSYNSRIYAYENNVLYGYSFPAFMDRGWRCYLNLSWKPFKIMTFYLKSGFTVYPDKEHLSSGVMQVEGNRQFDVTLQVRARF